MRGRARACVLMSGFLELMRARKGLQIKMGLLEVNKTLRRSDPEIQQTTKCKETAEDKHRVVGPTVKRNMVAAPKRCSTRPNELL
jgi:hypothetical protein